MNFIDSYKTLENHKDKYIYYKTDHHWTTLGAYYAFLEVAKKHGFSGKKPKNNVVQLKPILHSFTTPLLCKVEIGIIMKSK